MPLTMTIGEFARRCGLSVSALRFYDERGVMRPAEVDPSSGYRLYDEAQIETAGLLRDLRRLGFPIAAVRDLLDQPADVRHRAVDAHVEALAGSLRDARRTARALHQTIDDLELPVNAMSITAADFASAVAQVLPAVGVDPARPQLHGVLVEARDDSLRLVATDSHRLVVRDLMPRAGTATFRAVVDADALREVDSGTDPEGLVVIGADGTDLVIEPRGGTQVRLPVLRTEYPNYELFLDLGPGAHRLLVDGRDLLDALSDLGSVSHVYLRATPGGLTLESGGVAIEVPAQVDGDAVDVAMNPAYLIDAIEAAAGPDVAVEITSATTPVVVRGVDDGTYTCMVMPVMVRG